MQVYVQGELASLSSLVLLNREGVGIKGGMGNEEVVLEIKC